MDTPALLLSLKLALSTVLILLPAGVLVARFLATREFTGKPFVEAVFALPLVLPEGSPLRPDPTLDDLAKAVADGRLKRFAIANPEHAPYGRAAQEALIAAGVWPAIRGRLVLGENVAQAAQFAVSGSTQGGLVALSLALAPGALGGAVHVEIPATMHRPLRQRMALTRRAGEPARAFYDWLRGTAARPVLARYGFAAPTE